MNLLERDEPVSLWVDDCGRSWVKVRDYIAALEERDAARAEIERLTRLAFDEGDR